MLGTFVRKYLFAILTVTGTIGLTVTSFWLNTWLLDTVRALTRDNPEAEIYRIKVLASNIFKPDPPVLWFLISAFISFVGSLEIFYNRYAYGELKAKNDEIRNIKQENGESKKSYYETLASTLKYLLASREVGFDENCRVTIYRRQSNSDLHLKRIFRHSENYNYANEGRISVPIDQGIVGKAWGNHGEEEFQLDEDPASEAFETAMKEQLGARCIGQPHRDLSMPSRHYIALAVNDHDSGQRVAIVVYESTTCGTLNADATKRILTNDALDVARFVKHLGALHREFNPDAEGGANG